jgi:hypothetical protein
VPVVTRSNGKEADNMETDGWQDLDEYQREQEVVEGGLGPNDTELENELEVVKPTKIDKEARKKEKKLRAKEEKRKKAESKQKAKSEE